ncbi:hypothetical protein [Meiothermus sp.]|uniref:hypothetical protein n=1 Tax=Meiothermus sp. TaxID=1955249 RepID=UPI00307CE531
MQISPQAINLNRKSLRSFQALFITLKAPAAVQGVYRAEFVGPAWLRWVAPKGLWLLGLGGWCGKDFAANGAGINLLQREDTIIRRFPVQVALAPSRVDGQPCQIVTYPAVNPWPWPSVVDELRQLDEQTLLGLTFFKMGPLARLPLPFLLHKDV